MAFPCPHSTQLLKLPSFPSLRASPDHYLSTETAASVKLLAYMVR